MAGTGELLVQGIVALGGTGVLAAGANALLSRRKSKTEVEGARADAAKVLAEGAALLVKPLHDELEMVHRQIAQLRQREDANYELLRLHAAWDRRVADALRGAGLNVEAPPPLYLEDSTR
jgi:hypothetical protein